MLSFGLSLDIARDLLPAEFLAKILQEFLSYPMRTTCAFNHKSFLSNLLSLSGFQSFRNFTLKFPFPNCWNNFEEIWYIDLYLKVGEQT
jgi:hypothetical protein